MGIGREAAACTALHDGRVIVMGGRGGRRTDPGKTGQGPSGNRLYLDSVEVYDPSTDRWSDNIAPALHSARYGGAAVLLGGMVVVLGGADGHGELNRVESWDPLARDGSDYRLREWTTLAPMGQGVGRVLAAASAVQFTQRRMERMEWE